MKKIKENIVNQVRLNRNLFERKIYKLALLQENYLLAQIIRRYRKKNPKIKLKSKDQNLNFIKNFILLVYIVFMIKFQIQLNQIQLINARLLMLSLNNGMKSKKKLQKSVSWALSDSDNDIECLQNRSGDESDSKDSPSTQYSPTLNYQNQDQIDVEEFQMSQRCLQYFGEGYCDRGCDCTFIHEIRNMKEIIRQRVGKRLKLLQNFPEFILLSGQKRLNSFLS